MCRVWVTLSRASLGWVRACRADCRDSCCVTARSVPSSCLPGCLPLVHGGESCAHAKKFGSKKTKHIQANASACLQNKQSSNQAIR